MKEKKKRGAVGGGKEKGKMRCQCEEQGYKYKKYIEKAHHGYKYNKTRKESTAV